MGGRRGLLLGLLAAAPALAVASACLFARFYATGEGAAPAAAAVLALTAAVLGGERLAGGAPGGRVARLRALLLPWLMLAFVMNGGVRTWTISQGLPLSDALVGTTNTLAAVFAVSLAAMLIVPTLERLAAAARGETDEGRRPAPAHASAGRGRRDPGARA
ncbi:MAG TPA: hypothetical protein VJ994_09515 [Paracoccaceae bacterium]|nr:hypothetical protein [Paracoccaceae bacterium]